MTGGIPTPNCRSDLRRSGPSGPGTALREGGVRQESDLTKKVFTCFIAAFLLGTSFLFVLTPILVGGDGGRGDDEEKIFFEGWENGTIDTSIWEQVGSDPLPEIKDSGYFSDYSVDTNGGSSYAGSAITKQLFNPEGITISFHGKYDERGGSNWHQFNIHLVDDSEADFIRIKVSYEDAYGVGNVHYMVNDGAEGFEEGAGFADTNWHKYSAEVNENGTVSFFFDDELRWTSTQTVDTSDPSPLLINGRSYSKPHYMDNITVQYQDSNVTEVEDDFSMDLIWTAPGESGGDELGGFISQTPGDVNGDGFDDILVGSLYNSDGGSSAGKAYLYLGSEDGPSETPDWTFAGDVDDELGASVSIVGDLNNDGFDDVAIGARQTWTNKGGKVRVFYGSAVGLNDTADWSATGENGKDMYCRAAYAGDVNKDGFDDLLVGAEGYPSDNYQGRAYLYFGSRDGLGSSANWSFTGEANGDSLGMFLSSAGDVNRDGHADIVVGARLNDEGGDSAGKCYVFMGTTTGLNATPDWTFIGEDAGDRLGRCAGPGDLNADGFDDVIVSAIRAGPGKVYIFYGSETGLNDTEDWSAEGHDDGDNYGHSMDVVDDINGDGHVDLVVGAPLKDSSGPGYVQVFLGTSAGLKDTPAWKVSGEASGDHFGRMAASAGDVNKDGFHEIYIGTPYNDENGNRAGKAYVYAFNITEPILTMVSNETVYEQGDTVTINATYTGGSCNITFQVKDGDNDTYAVKTMGTDPMGYVQYTFKLADDAHTGDWTVFATNDKDSATASIQFQVKEKDIPIPPFIRIKELQVAENLNRGDVCSVVFVIESTYPDSMLVTLVLQLEDKDLLPITPEIQVKSISGDSESSHTLSVIIPGGGATGTYDVQGQMLTELPENGGYAMDFVDATTIVS